MTPTTPFHWSNCPLTAQRAQSKAKGKAEAARTGTGSWPTGGTGGGTGRGAGSRGCAWLVSTASGGTKMVPLHRSADLTAPVLHPGDALFSSLMIIPGLAVEDE